MNNFATLVRTTRPTLLPSSRSPCSITSGATHHHHQLPVLSIPSINIDSRPHLYPREGWSCPKPPPFVHPPVMSEDHNHTMADVASLATC